MPVPIRQILLEMHQTDSELSAWFCSQVAPHAPGLKAWLRARFYPLTDVDDVVQDAFIRVLKAKHQSELSSPKAFLYATARNLALDQLNRMRVVPLTSIGEADLSGFAEKGRDPHELLAREQEREILMEAIQALPERCRRIFTLRKIYGMSQKEISVQMGISENTVSAQLTIGFHRCSEYVLAHTKRRRATP